MRIVLLVAAAAAASFAVPAIAQDKVTNQDACANEDGVFDDAHVVTACTALIQSGTLASDDLVSVLATRGLAYLDQNNFTRAIADYSEAIRLNPKNKVSFAHRGGAYWAQKNYSRAIADFSEAIRLDPQYADALYFRGVSENELGRKAEGAAHIARAKAIDPDIDK